ncbi:hypothetical protein Droror1_Dr00025464 [Drosera rotundifolia]
MGYASNWFLNEALDVIQGYASNWFLNEALDVFDQMILKNVKPDCYTMVSVLLASACVGTLYYGERASKLIE